MIFHMSNRKLELCFYKLNPNENAIKSVIIYVVDKKRGRIHGWKQTKKAKKYMTLRN